MRLSTVIIVGVALAAAGVGVYELGKGAKGTAREVSTIAIGIPDQASVAAAEANLAGATSAADAYRAEHGGYAGMTNAGLLPYGGVLSGVTVVRADAVSYCIQSTVRASTVSIRGPSGADAVGPC